MNRDTEFEKWYEEYFCNTQGEDSPYSYNDVKIAYYSGWKKHKEEAILKSKILNVLNEEVSKPESHKGMVGWTIPSFHQFIDSLGKDVPDYIKNFLKTQCTSFLHKNGLQVDVAEYHDRVLQKLELE